MRSVTAVVVTFNRRPLLERLVARLREVPEVAEILVVDNASTDGSGEWLRTQDGTDRVVGGALHEVAGAVDRVDGEGVLGGGVAVQDRGVAGRGLLAQHDRVGVGPGQRRGDQHLGLAVGDGHEVAGVLLADLVGREAPEPRRHDLGGHVLQEGGDRVGVHPLTVG